MKKIALNLFALGLVASVFTACDDAKYDTIDNMVYISEATGNDPSSEIVVGQAGTESSTKITIRMAQRATADVKVQLQMDENTLAAYNKRNETEFVMIPAEYVSFPSEVVIPAGASQVEAAITITSFDGEAGVDYAAPIKIAGAQGVEVANATSSFIVTLGKTLIQKAPGFSYNNAMTMNWEEPVEFTNLTLEWWVRVVNTAGNGGFSVNNQALFDFQKEDKKPELYIRFGDITYGGQDTRPGKHEFLQIKTMGIDANYDSGDPNDESKKLPWGTWIHFAHTYDAATGDVVLYKNGVEVNRANGGKGTILKYNGLSMCSSGRTYFRDYIEMCQVRLWKTTRSAAQIQKFMNKEVKYTDPNLVFYLPMNEGQGSVLHDVTGNGYDVTIGSHESNGGNNQAHSWTEYSFE